MILWGVFYFISETLLGLARSSSQSDFLKSFYTFSSVFDSGEFEILTSDGYHIWLLESPNTWEGILLWVVDIQSLRLIPPTNYDIYLPAVVGYRQVSQAEITTLSSNPSSAYLLDFQRDRVFDNFFVRDFKLNSFNSWALHELELYIFPQYYEALRGLPKSQVSQDETFTYSLTF